MNNQNKKQNKHRKLFISNFTDPGWYSNLQYHCVCKTKSFLLFGKLQMFITWRLGLSVNYCKVMLFHLVSLLSTKFYCAARCCSGRTTVGQWVWYLDPSCFWHAGLMGLDKCGTLAVATCSGRNSWYFPGWHSVNFAQFSWILAQNVLEEILWPR